LECYTTLLFEPEKWEKWGGEESEKIENKGKKNGVSQFQITKAPEWRFLFFSFFFWMDGCIDDRIDRRGLEVWGVENINNFWARSR